MRATLSETSPASEAELLRRAGALAGYTLRELAQGCGVDLPAEPKRAKGYIGELVERALGATAKNQSRPDFPDLGIELKSIPLDRRGRPQESTFICSINLTTVSQHEWEQSPVRQKLARVLFVPVESAPALPFGDRRIGTPRLWSPDAAQRAALRADWEDLITLLSRGEYERITGHLGRCLQIRPKAAHGAVQVRGADADGVPMVTRPRGFYLRRCVTQAVFAP